MERLVHWVGMHLSGWLARAILAVLALLACGWMLWSFLWPSRSDRRPERMELWPSSHLPTGKKSPRNAFVTIHPPSHSSGTAVVICPGGGYGALNLDIEGHGIARWLNQQGITGIVLEYRLPHGDPTIPLVDAQQAIRLVRAHAEEWRIRPDRVGIIGFSSGGHLASMAATLEASPLSPSLGSMTEISSRPDFAILVYPVISMGPLADAGSRQNLLGPSPSPEKVEAFSTHRQVTSQTPPVFLIHARDDQVVPVENSRLFLESLEAHGVPVVFHELQTGGHGLGYGGPLWKDWQAQALVWMRYHGFLPEKHVQGPHGRRNRKNPRSATARRRSLAGISRIGIAWAC